MNFWRWGHFALCARPLSAANGDGCSNAQSERSKKVVIEFYNALNRGDIAGMKKYARLTIIQHNPDVADGLQGLIDRTINHPGDAVTLAGGPNRPANSPPIPAVQFARVVAECDFVVLLRHKGISRYEQPTPQAEIANVDFFRVQDGKVAEHWDFLERFPRGSDPPKNDNGRF